MGNQIAVNLLCRPGDTLVTDDGAHALTAEAGGVSALSGVMVKTIPAHRGDPDTEALDTALAAETGDGRPRTGLLLLENTHMRAGGTVIPEERMGEIGQMAATRGIPVHVDGARFFNAAVYLGIPASYLARHVDTVVVSLNKGLCAPFGAVLAGDAGFIKAAVQIRQRFGGGWRPVGIPAAAGIVALEEMVDRLAEDHERARRLADALGEIDGVSVENQPVETNLVMIKVNVPGLDNDTVMDRMKEKGVLILSPIPGILRFTVFNDITDEDIDRTVSVLHAIVSRSS
jgi:threonine aldolase